MFMPRIMVGMGMTQILKKGQAGKLYSGHLTYCSALVFKVLDQHNEVIGVGMTHRGIETEDLFRKNFRNTLSELGDPSNLKIEPCALQTAPDTHIKNVPYSDTSMPKGSHENTLDALIQAMASESKMDTNELFRLSEAGPKANFLANDCTAEVNSNGEVMVPKRKNYWDQACSIC
ncbi:hypothetical protein [Microbulbifer spongiae]|uniref:Uncharacterized protein n=1 Tax=Microbulbifer spongiae TaxID=2944933 RepID=A0ABY9EFQ2_9GAMM|nr:hypothetical protein [Microbulbifer sp. MI-G]WKD51251.1 hypothetical protein M8T91_07495 [Microbulbifer sp. MI-G]